LADACPTCVGEDGEHKKMACLIYLTVRATSPIAA
jgi:hypothetical protein